MNPNTCGCEYLTDDDKQCAIGMFIPKDVLKKNRKEYNFCGQVDGLLEVYPKMRQFMPLKGRGLAYFQEEHDLNYKSTDAEVLARLIDWIEENVKD